jgi:hypothetical protein
MSQCLHLLDVLLEASLACRGLKVLDDPFVILEFFLLKLSLDLLWVEELKGVRYEFEAFVGFINH